MKKERHNKIIELISQQKIDTQEKLANALRQAGYQVTQATVSRDIRELNLKKIPVQSGGQRYSVPVVEHSGIEKRYLRILKEGFVSMDMAQNILVIKTGAGLAMAVAAALDGLHWQELVGCIAGDDTIMCAIRTVEDTKKVMRKIQEFVQDS